MFKRPQKVIKTSKKNCKETQREKETTEIMEVLYNFNDLHKMVKYEEFY